MPVSKLVQLATAESVISGLPGEAFRMAVDQADLAISITRAGPRNSDRRISDSLAQPQAA